VAAILAGGDETFREWCAQAEGLVHFAASGETSWHGFACAIVDGLRGRGSVLAAERLIPIPSADYPTRAQRPHNSRLDLARWCAVFNQTPPSWQAVLEPVLDEMAMG
jgi:dTDP-4-dehydrorhamnose reductase